MAATTDGVGSTAAALHSLLPDVSDISALFPSGRDLVQRELDFLSVLESTANSITALQRTIPGYPIPPLTPYRMRRAIRDTRLAFAELLANFHEILSMTSQVARQAKGLLAEDKYVDSEGVLEEANELVCTLRVVLQRQTERIAQFCTTWTTAAKAELAPTPPPAPRRSFSSRFSFFLKVSDPYPDSRLLVSNDIVEHVSNVEGHLAALQSSFEDLEAFWSLWRRAIVAISSGSGKVELDNAWMQQEWDVENKLRGCRVDVERIWRKFTSQERPLTYAQMLV